MKEEGGSLRCRLRGADDEVSQGENEEGDGNSQGREKHFVGVDDR